MDESTTSNIGASDAPSYDSTFNSVAEALQQYGINIATDGETVTYDTNLGAGTTESVDAALGEYGLSIQGEGSDSQEGTPEPTGDLAGTPWDALKGTGGIESLGDVFSYVGDGNASTGGSGSPSTDGAPDAGSGDSDSQGESSQAPGNQFLQSPWGRLESVGIDSYEGVFGGAGGGGSNPMGGEGSDSSAGGGSGSPIGGGSGGGASSDLPYGGNPFAGDNFWNIFAGGVNPSNIGSGGGSMGGSIGGEESADSSSMGGGSSFGGGSMGGFGGGGGFGG